MLRLYDIKPPFKLRLINGRVLDAFEATVLITKVTRNLRRKRYELRIGSVLNVKHWK